MDQKIIKKIFILAGITLAVILLVFNYYSFVTTSKRILEIFDIKNLENYFEIYLENNHIIFEETVQEINVFINNTIEVFQNRKPLKELVLDFVVKSLFFIIDFINYFLNIGINIILLLFIFFHETFNGTNLNIKYSKPAQLFIKFTKLLSFIKNKTILFIKLVKMKLIQYKRVIALFILITLFSNGILYKFLVELLIFIITYIYHAINLESFIVISSLGQAIFIFLYPLLIKIPYLLLIIALIILGFLKAIKRANFKLQKNHERLKDFASNTLTQTTFINGTPGVGKTLLNVSLSLASEENFIEILQDILLEYEIKYPTVNFADVRMNSGKYPEHKEYLKNYEFLNSRSSFIISNYAIYSPYFKDYSKIFDFNFVRKNIKTKTYALEEYIIISLSELDKEYNSHDDMKAVGEDGAATFFSVTSHDLKRHVKIFCDYQLKDQVPLRIRGNSEYFLTVKKRKKKYPVLLYIYYFPFVMASKTLRRLITRYETKRAYIANKTLRKGISKYKRNDFNLTYAILRRLANSINKICDFFDHFWYFKLTVIISEEDNAKGEIKNINLNICDLSIEDMALYDSTFLSYAYEEKKNRSFKDLDKYSSLRPTIEELTLCNSRFYNKINGLEQVNKPFENKKTSDDEFIDV